MNGLDHHSNFAAVLSVLWLRKGLGILFLNLIYTCSRPRLKFERITQLRSLTFFLQNTVYGPTIYVYSSLVFPGRFVAVDPNSDYGKNILSVVQRSYIDTAYKNQRWHVSNIVAISNQHIVNKYR